jgi:hypothetical protein
MILVQYTGTNVLPMRHTNIGTPILCFTMLEKEKNKQGKFGDSILLVFDKRLFT